MKKIILALLVLVIHYFSYGQTVIDVSMLSTFSHQSLLWKVEGEGIQPAFIFGTLHMIPEKDFFISDATQKAFDESDMVVMEMDLSDPNLSISYMNYALLPDSTTIQDYCTEEEFELLQSHFKELQSESMWVFKPFVLNSMFLMNLLDEPMESYEMSLIQKAKASEKKIVGLESIEFQMKTLNFGTFEEQIDNMIEGFITNKEKSQEEFRNLVKTYKNQDIAELYQAISDKLDSEEFKESLLDQRNANWAKELQDICSEERCFIAVGSGHLAGEKGLLNLLQKEGYTVSPIFE